MVKWNIFVKISEIITISPLTPGSPTAPVAPTAPYKLHPYKDLFISTDSSLCKKFTSSLTRGPRLPSCPIVPMGPGNPCKDILSKSF